MIFSSFGFEIQLTSILNIKVLQFLASGFWGQVFLRLIYEDYNSTVVLIEKDSNPFSIKTAGLQKHV